MFCSLFLIWFFFGFFRVVDVRLGVDTLMAASATEVARKGLRFVDVGSLAHFSWSFCSTLYATLCSAPFPSLPFCLILRCGIRDHGVW